MTTTAHIVSESNAAEIAAQIVLDVDNGRSIVINGETPIASFEAAPARSYANGTVSIMVAAKAKGKVREVFFKAGTVLTVVTDEPGTSTPEPSEADPTPTPEPDNGGSDEAPDAKPVKSKSKSKAKPVEGDVKVKHTVTATLKGETGFLAVRRVDGSFAYAVTMEEKSASKFADGPSLERHIARATAGGIKVAA